MHEDVRAGREPSLRTGPVHPEAQSQSTRLPPRPAWRRVSILRNATRAGPHLWGRPACLTLPSRPPLRTYRSVRRSWSGVHREVAGHGSGVRDARAGRGRMASAKIVGHRESSRFVRSSGAFTRAVTRFGSLRALPRTRQFFRWAKPCSTGAHTAARALLGACALTAVAARLYLPGAPRPADHPSTAETGPSRSRRNPSTRADPL